MWFYNNDYGTYWLTNTENRHLEDAPEIIPTHIGLPVRRVEEGDWTWEVINGVTEQGIRGRYRWMCNDTFVEPGTPVKADFPKIVTPKTLADFFSSGPKKLETIKLDDHTSVYRTKNGEQYYLMVDGNRLLSWAGPFLYFGIRGSLTEHQVEALKKYLGKTWKFVEKDGLGWVENAVKDQLPISPDVPIMGDGTIQDGEAIQKIINSSIGTYKNLLNVIREYVASITLERFREATSGMTSNTHSIMTRCDECQKLSGRHLEVHMARKDLDVFLIYATYDNFGSDLGPIPQTWNLISNPTNQALTEFKDILEKFLMDTLRPKIGHLSFMPLKRREGGIPWKLYNDMRYKVDGNRLIAGRENEGLGEREGDQLAAEAERAGRVEEGRPNRLIIERNRLVINPDAGANLRGLRRRIDNPFNEEPDINPIEFMDEARIR